MGRRSHTRRLTLWMNGERVGAWSLGPDGDELRYDDAWLESPQRRPLSLSLPFRPGNLRHRGPAVRAYFENLLPDSTLIRQRIARRFAARTTDAFDLLAEVGRDCAGALYIAPGDEPPGDISRLDAEPLDEAGVARLLRAVANVGGRGAADDDAQDLRISIAGAQEKTALLWHQGRWWRPLRATPTTHIFKLPLGRVGNLQLDLSDSVDNEWLCAQILEAFGLPIAKCHPLVFEDQRVLAVERFDRRWSPDGKWLLRLPQEDMCQATATPPHLKYEADGGPGIDTIMGLLNGSAQRERDREVFFRAQLLFWLLCAPDGHAKNFSLALHAGGSYSLAPLYDVMSAYPLLGEGPGRLSRHKVKMAMAVRSQNPHWKMRDIQARHWAALAQRYGIGVAEGSGRAVVQAVARDTAAALDTVQRQLPAKFPAHVYESVVSGISHAADAILDAE
ncbi:MAG: type II toxin-antitoxin system HipA family toxin [Burkholderiaceae bacterium]